MVFITIIFLNIKNKTNVKAEISNMFNKKKMILFNHLTEYFPVHRLRHETNKQNHYVIKQNPILWQFSSPTWRFWCLDLGAY